MIRINKYLSQCGVASRREADVLISKHRVKVNGVVVEKPGLMVDEDNDVVAVDGKIVGQVKKMVYIVMNKPDDAVTTLKDPQGRRTVTYYLRGLNVRVYPVGRLDYDSEGVLLLTNDGELSHRLTHPRYGVKKVYEATVEGQFKKTSCSKIKSGIKLDDGATGHADVKILDYEGNISKIWLTLKEGRKREVKQMCKAVGHPVIKLRRIEFAGVINGDLTPGQWRHLSDSEVLHLKILVGLK